jgi:hypothetical protein
LNHILMELTKIDRISDFLNKDIELIIQNMT